MSVELDQALGTLIQAELAAARIRKEDEALIKAYLQGEDIEDFVSLPEPEEATTEQKGPSKLYQLISVLAQSTDVEPDPFIIGLSVMGEDKWQQKHKQAAW